MLTERICSDFKLEWGLKLPPPISVSIWIIHRGIMDSLSSNKGNSMSLRSLKCSGNQISISMCCKVLLNFAFVFGNFRLVFQQVRFVRMKRWIADINDNRQWQSLLEKGTFQRDEKAIQISFSDNGTKIPLRVSPFFLLLCEFSVKSKFSAGWDRCLNWLSTSFLPLFFSLWMSK